MTADELKQKIEQCERDEESIRLNREDLEKQLKEIGESENLEPGDLAANYRGHTRLIVKDSSGKVFSVNVRGYHESDENQFRSNRYQKVGQIDDYIKDMWSENNAN